MKEDHLSPALNAKCPNAKQNGSEVHAPSRGRGQGSRGDIVVNHWPPPALLSERAGGQ